MELIICGSFAFCAGFLLAFIIFRKKDNGDLAVKLAKLEEQNRYLNDAAQDKAALENKVKELEIHMAAQLQKLNSANEKLQSEQTLTDLIKKEFTNIANNALIEKQELLQKQNVQTLDMQIKPLKEQLNQFQTKVEEFNLNGVKNTETIKEQILNLTRENTLIKNQAEKLANALKDNSKTRGILGEIILENVLKSSGLINRNDDPKKGNYLTQTSFRDLNNPNGSKIFPDAVIFFPEDNKNVIIDSKLPLNDFTEFINEENEEEKASHYKNFTKAAELKVDELSDKYSNLEGLNTPDFTLMFVPFESCINLIYSNPKLIEYAHKKNVIIVGPTSLFATLRVINYAWSQKNQASNIKEILGLGEGIYSKCQTFIQKMERLHTAFSSVENGFSTLFATLKGKGGLIGQIDKFRQLGFNPVNPIEDKYITQEGEVDKIPVLAVDD